MLRDILLVVLVDVDGGGGGGGTWSTKRTTSFQLQSCYCCCNHHRLTTTITGFSWYGLLLLPHPWDASSTTTWVWEFFSMLIIIMSVLHPLIFLVYFYSLVYQLLHMKKTKTSSVWRQKRYYCELFHGILTHILHYLVCVVFVKLQFFCEANQITLFA